MAESSQKRERSSFFFRYMISTDLIKIFYIIGAIIITVFGLIIFSREDCFYLPYAICKYKSILAIAFIVLGNMLWRIICERLILPFSMHEVLCSIEKELKKRL